MKSVQKSVRELSSEALRAVRGGVDLDGRRTSTNVEFHVVRDGVLYKYDYQGRLISAERIAGSSGAGESGGGTGSGGGSGW